MNLSLTLAMTLAAALVAAAPTTAPPASSGAAAAKHYICPPCAQPCDAKIFDAPGTCPQCGMALVDAASAPAPEPTKKVAILLFNGVEIIDSMGPYEVFGATGYDVYTVAATKDPVTSAMGMTLVPKHTFADAPIPDVLVVPGGGIGNALHSDATTQYVKETSAKATLTMSVCNGAFILANAGLLDGLTATTTAHNIPKLAAQYPKVKVVTDQRYVDNGKIITTGGLSAGIDGAIHVVERLDGRGAAQEVALGEEYDWKPGHGFARASMADQEIPRIDMDKIGHWEVTQTEGGADHWQFVMKGSADMTATQLADYIGKGFIDAKWKTADAAAATTPAGSRWSFTGRDGKPWNGTLRIEPEPGNAKRFTASLELQRAS